MKVIDGMEAILKVYINEATDVEKAGLEVNFKKNSDYVIPEELQNKFDEIPDLKTAFEAFTPGWQRAYLLYFSQPKQGIISNVYLVVAVLTLYLSSKKIAQKNTEFFLVFFCMTCNLLILS